MNSDQTGSYEEYQTAYLLMKVDALDHTKRIARANIRIWHTRVSKWYSSNSKSTHNEVATPRTPPVHQKLSCPSKAKCQQLPTMFIMRQRIEQTLTHTHRAYNCFLTFAEYRKREQTKLKYQIAIWHWENKLRNSYLFSESEYIKLNTTKK